MSTAQDYMTHYAAKIRSMISFLVSQIGLREILYGVIISLALTFSYGFFRSKTAHLSRTRASRKLVQKISKYLTLWLFLLMLLVSHEALKKWNAPHVEQWQRFRPAIEPLWLLIKVSLLGISLYLFRLLIKLFFLFTEDMISTAYKTLGISQVVEGVTQFVIGLAGISWGISLLFGVDMKAWYRTLSIGTATITGVVAFASKDLIANFFGAIVVLAGRPFRLNDWIVVQGIEGRVDHISMRVTQLCDRQGVMHHLPNSLFLSKGVKNYGKGIPIYFKLKLAPSHDEKDIDIALLFSALSLLVKEAPYIAKQHLVASTYLPDQPLVVDWHISLVDDGASLRVFSLKKLEKQLSAIAERSHARLTWSY